MKAPPCWRAARRPPWPPWSCTPLAPTGQWLQNARHNIPVEICPVLSCPWGKNHRNWGVVLTNLMVFLLLLLSWLLHVIQTALHVLQVVLGYMLMLCVMSYNTWIFLGVVLGSVLGYFLSFPLLDQMQSFRLV